MKLLSKKKIYSNEVFNFYKNSFLLDSKKIINGYLSIDPKNINKKSGGVMVIPIKNHKIGLMNAHYPIINKKLFCLPQGFCDNKENPKEAALRELKEETGYETDKISINFLCKLFPNPSLINSKISIYTAKKLRLTNSYKNLNLEIGMAKLNFYSKKELLNLMYKKNFDLTSLSALMYFYFLKKI